MPPRNEYGYYVTNIVPEAICVLIFLQSYPIDSFDLPFSLSNTKLQLVIVNLDACQRFNDELGDEPKWRW